MLEKEEIPENRHNIIVTVSVLLFLCRVKKLKIMIFDPGTGVTLMKTDRPGEHIFQADCLASEWRFKSLMTSHLQSLRLMITINPLRLF